MALILVGQLALRFLSGAFHYYCLFGDGGGGKPLKKRAAEIVGVRKLRWGEPTEMPKYPLSFTARRTSSVLFYPGDLSDIAVFSPIFLWQPEPKAARVRFRIKKVNACGGLNRLGSPKARSESQLECSLPAVRFLLTDWSVQIEDEIGLNW